MMLLICDKDDYVFYHIFSHNNLNILMSSKLSASGYLTSMQLYFLLIY